MFISIIIKSSLMGQTGKFVNWDKWEGCQPDGGT